MRNQQNFDRGNNFLAPILIKKILTQKSLVFRYKKFNHHKKLGMRMGKSTKNTYFLNEAFLGKK